MVQYAIYGNGCIGSCVGILLANQGHSVSFIGREDSERFKQMKKNKQLTLVGPESNLEIVLNDPMLTSDPERGLSNRQVIFVATKRFTNDKVCNALLRYAKQDALVVLLQNGLGPKQDFAPLLANSNITIVESVVNFNVTASAEVPGRFRWVSKKGDSSIVVEPGENVQAWVCDALNECGLKCSVDFKFAEVSTGKVLVNMINAPNALAGCDLEQFLLHKHYRLVWSAAMYEAREVFKAMGVPTQRSASGQGDFQLQHLWRILRLAPEFAFQILASKQNSKGAKTSMLQDLENRAAQTEVEYLSGRIVAEGKQHNVPTPVNAKLVELVTEACNKREGSPKLTPLELYEAVGLLPRDDPMSCTIM